MLKPNAVLSLYIEVRSMPRGLSHFVVRISSFASSLAFNFRQLVLATDKRCYTFVATRFPGLHHVSGEVKLKI
jgi:hypothetical protein